MLECHGNRWIAGRELVGTKTCGSTLSSACSRSFIAYLAKSAAVAYGEVDCSSARRTPTAPVRSNRARLRFIGKAWPVSIRSFHVAQGFSLWKNQRRWRLQLLKHYPFHPYVLLIRVFWMYSRSSFSA